MKNKTFARIGAVLVAAALTVGCGATLSNIQSWTDTAGATCEVVLTATDPSLAPICTSAQQFALAVEALFGADSGTAVAARKLAAAAPDAGSVVSTLTVAQRDQLYGWLVAHGAKAVKN